MKHVKSIVVFLLVFSSRIACFVIDEPGEITLGGNIAESGVVISIQSDNVILDLDNNMITSGTIGIQVNPGITNVLIKNGFIHSCTVGI